MKFGSLLMKKPSEMSWVEGLKCPRIGCFRAAVSILTNRSYEYEVNEVNLNKGCKGTIRLIR